jgi:hypothetical protein
MYRRDQMLLHSSPNSFVSNRRLIIMHCPRKVKQNVNIRWVTTWMNSNNFDEACYHWYCDSWRSIEWRRRKSRTLMMTSMYCWIFQKGKYVTRIFYSYLQIAMDICFNSIFGLMPEVVIIMKNLSQEDSFWANKHGYYSNDPHELLEKYFNLHVYKRSTQTSFFLVVVVVVVVVVDHRRHRIKTELFRRINYWFNLSMMIDVPYSNRSIVFNWWL